jgi:hypothetical protein
MASDKQLHANRANAKKSTGPRSQVGKSRSRLNSRKHGLTAKMLVIGYEDADQFEELRADLMAGHDPQSALEAELVERLAGIFWRLRRVPFFEAAILDARQAQVAEDIREEEARGPQRWHGYEEEEREEGDADEDADEMSHEEWSVYVGRALIRDGVFGDGLGKLARHEASLMNAFTKTLKMLLLLQENRSNTRGDPVMIETIALRPAP